MSRKIAAGALALSLLVVPSLPASAEPVQYVKVCSRYGAGFYYIPGTATCINPKTGVMKQETSHGTVTENSDVLNDALKAKEGVALSLAMPTATVTPGHHFGAAFNIGTFDGSTALGVGGAWQANDNVTVNGALGIGDQGDVGGRGGVNVSW
jgi:hypothetical protein